MCFNKPLSHRAVQDFCVIRLKNKPSCDWWVWIIWGWMGRAVDQTGVTPSPVWGENQRLDLCESAAAQDTETPVQTEHQKKEMRDLSEIMLAWMLMLTGRKITREISLISQESLHAFTQYWSIRQHDFISQVYLWMHAASHVQHFKAQKAVTNVIVFLKC